MLRELERRRLEIGEVDLAETARVVAAGLAASDRVVIDIPEGTVAADRNLIVEILTDLLEYALKDSRDRRTVTICADSEQSGLRLWVNDHGVGIDPADQAAILDRFHRLAGSATRPHGGPGLGLHLAKAAVEEL
jgi:signal transduction histidine kinase